LRSWEDDTPTKAGPWDVMLSYRHAAHKPAVTRLAKFLDEAGVRCWLDTHIIDQTTTHPRDYLKRILRDAAEVSRVIVGFPAVDMLEKHPHTEEARLSFSWLFWERQYAREFLWVDGNWLCSFPDHRMRFFYYPQLAYFLGLACGKGKVLTPFWQKYFGEMSLTTRAAYGTEDLHTLPTELLPSIINPEEPDARRNAILRSSIGEREDLAEDHRMEILE
jgi:hypothetical protein